VGVGLEAKIKQLRGSVNRSMVRGMVRGLTQASAEEVSEMTDAIVNVFHKTTQKTTRQQKDNLAETTRSQGNMNALKRATPTLPDDAANPSVAAKTV
jgi:hypothetical protein